MTEPNSSARVVGRFPRLLLIWADGGYAGRLVDWVRELCHWTLQIVKRSDDAAAFVVLPMRWVVGEQLRGLADTAA